MDFHNIPCDIGVSVTLVARLLLQLFRNCACVNMVYSQAEHVFCTLHENHLLLFVKHLAVHTLTRKYQLR